MIGAINRLFMNATLRRVLVKLRAPLGLIVAAGVLFSIDRRFLWWAVGTCLLGEFIQLWCFANLDKQGELACRGPYALCRNPMYLGRFFIVLGPLLLLGCWPLLVLYVPLYWFYMYNRVRREEKTLTGVLGEAYREYLAEVNRFLPGWPWRDHPILTWQWRLFRQNHGPVNLLGTLVFLGLAVCMAWWWPYDPWWWPATATLPDWWWLVSLPRSG